MMLLWLRLPLVALVLGMALRTHSPAVGSHGMDQLPSEQWYNLPDHLLPLFLHHCIDRICGRNGGGMEQMTPKIFADENSFQTAVELCQQRLMQWIDIRDKKDVTIDIHDERKKVIYECLECRRPELRTAVVAGIVRDSVKGLFVMDFDWKVNYVFSSNKVSGINEPIAVMTLSLSNGETCMLDLSLNEVDALLQTLKQTQSLLPD